MIQYLHNLKWKNNNMQYKLLSSYESRGNYYDILYTRTKWRNINNETTTNI